MKYNRLESQDSQIIQKDTCEKSSDEFNAENHRKIATV